MLNKLLIPIFVGAGIAAVLVALFPNAIFIGPIAGAIIASSIALGSAEYYKAVEADTHRKALCGALVAEMMQLRELIETRRTQIQSIQSFEVIISITEDYFVVFSQNAGRIGILGRDQAKKVIKAYMETKGLFDTVRMYVDFCRELTNVKIRLRRMEIEGRQLEPLYQASCVEVTNRENALRMLFDEIFQSYVPKALALLEEAEENLREYS